MTMTRDTSVPFRDAHRSVTARGAWAGRSAWQRGVTARVTRAAALALIAVLAVACGGNSLPPGVTLGPPDTVSDDCATALGGLTEALFELDSRLSVGLTYADYSQKVGDARVEYDQVKISDLDADCIRGVGKPAEDAMNEYLSAYTIWNDCNGNTSCKSDSIKPQLQDHWAVATLLLAQVKGRLP